MFGVFLLWLNKGKSSTENIFGYDECNLLDDLETQNTAMKFGTEEGWIALGRSWALQNVFALGVSLNDPIDYSSLCVGSEGAHIIARVILEFWTWKEMLIKLKREEAASVCHYLNVLLDLEA